MPRPRDTPRPCHTFGKRYLDGRLQFTTLELLRNARLFCIRVGNRGLTGRDAKGLEVPARAAT